MDQGPIKPYSCAVCHSRFSSIPELNWHSNNYEGECKQIVQSANPINGISPLKGTQLLNTGNGMVMTGSPMVAYAATPVPQLVSSPSVLMLPTSVSQPAPVFFLGQGPVSGPQLPQSLPPSTKLETSYPKVGSGNHTYKFHYMCKTCNARFDALEPLEDHVAEDHRVYACRICHLNFSRQTSLTGHMDIDHGGNPLYPCEVKDCNTYSNCVGELIKHYLLVHPSNVLICWPCNALFYSDKQLHQHFEKEHPSDE